MTSFLDDDKLSPKASHFFVLMSSCLFYFSFPNVFSLKGQPSFIYFFALFLFKALHQKLILQRFFLGLVAGLTSYLLLVSWVFPVDWKGYGLFACGLAMQPVFFCCLYKEDFSSEWMNILYPPSLWVATEYLRTGLLGGFSWTLGHSQSFISPVIQIMDLTGAYGISFFIIVINVCLYRLLKKRKKGLIYLMTMLFCVGLILFYAHKQLTFYTRASMNQKTEICTVQPNIPPQEKLNPDKLKECLDKQVTMSYACLAKGDPDMIIWPEVAIPDDFNKRQWILQEIRTLIREINTPILLGSAMLINGKDYNSVALINKKGLVSHLYHKRILIPFAEYYPFKEENLFKKMVYTNKFNFIAGEEAGNFEMPIKNSPEGKNIPFGVLICSEEVYPKLIRDLRNKKPQFIAALLNDGWFACPEALMMHLQAAIVQSVSFRIPFVRASNTGASVQINAIGKVVNWNKSMKEEGYNFNQKKVFLFNVSCKKMKSFYSQYGDIFSLICLLFVFLINCKSYLVNK